MMDLNWITSEAHRIHDFFHSIFYVFVSLLLIVGIFIEYFKMSLGAMPAFQTLLMRSLIAVILLVAYPEISNTIASIADAVSNQLGNFQSMHEVLSKAGEAIHQRSFSWTSASDWIVVAISYIVYFFLYISIFFYDAGIVFCLTILYVFSPVLIALYVLPQTASACSGLFRSLFEVAAWKVNFSVLASLLWNASLKAFDKTTPEGSNYILQLVVILMLAVSVLCTPMIVNALLQGGMSGVVSKFSGMALGAATNGLMTPQKVMNAPYAPIKGAGTLAVAKFAPPIKKFAKSEVSRIKNDQSGGTLFSPRVSQAKPAYHKK
jgi:hypothetical protein